MSDAFRLQLACGEAVLPWLDRVAALRIEVFRDFPYLYDGTFDYERNYLRAYAASPRSLFVLASMGDALVGASTALPLAAAGAEFQAPFIARGIPVETVFYFGESVLQAAYRGSGMGHRFFDAREYYAREHGFAVTAFCAVVRPVNHPARPAGYRPLDAFWHKRGYEAIPGMVAHYHWRDTGDKTETDKPMQFWLRTGCGMTL